MQDPAYFRDILLRIMENEAPAPPPSADEFKLRQVRRMVKQGQIQCTLEHGDITCNIDNPPIELAGGRHATSLYVFSVPELDSQQLYYGTAILQFDPPFDSMDDHPYPDSMLEREVTDYFQSLGFDVHVEFSEQGQQEEDSLHFDASMSIETVERWKSFIKQSTS